jgi:hypothetical protein
VFDLQGTASRSRFIRVTAKGIRKTRFVIAYWAGQVLVQTTYDSLHARNVSVLKPTWFPWETHVE